MGHLGRKAEKILRIALHSLKPFGWSPSQRSIQQHYESSNNRQQSEQQRL